MAFTKGVWDQLRATTVEQFIVALERDGFAADPAIRGAVRVFLKPEAKGNRRVVIHYHPRKTWGAKFLKGLLDDAGWKESDLYRLGLVAPISASRPSTLETYLVPCACNLGVLEDGSSCPECGGTRFREVPKP
jgi:predicted RNA binding protein YcfA (HicA-like mRNA interferase family)